MTMDSRMRARGYRGAGSGAQRRNLTMAPLTTIMCRSPGAGGRALPDVGRRDDILIITREDTTGQRLPMRQKVIRETRFSIN